MTDDLAKQLRTDAEAYRQSIAAPTSHDMFTLAYQWQDKKHRHVWDLCSKLETAADCIEKLEAALRPFAEWADSYEPDEGDGHEVAWGHDATIGMLRAARAALEGKDD